MPLCCRGWVCMKADVGNPLVFTLVGKRLLVRFFCRPRSPRSPRSPLTDTLHSLILSTHSHSRFPTMTDTVLASTTLTVNCESPAANGKITLNAYSNPNYNSIWGCTFTNRTPQLEISIVWTCTNGHQGYLQLYNIQSLRVVSRDGAIVYSTPVNGVVHSAPLIGMAFIC